jgi:hypothetical protein
MTVRSELLEESIDKEIFEEIIGEENISSYSFPEEDVDTNSLINPILAYSDGNQKTKIRYDSSDNRRFSADDILQSPFVSEDYFSGVLGKAQRFGITLNGNKKNRSFDTLNEILEHHEPIMYANDESSIPLRIYLSEEISPFMRKMYDEIGEELNPLSNPELDEYDEIGAEIDFPLNAESDEYYN